MHPRIKYSIDLLNANGYTSALDERSLILLKGSGATSTEAMITIHLGFEVPDVDAERMVFSSNLWGKEAIQDIAYQTFLYMNYDPQHPDFEFDENRIKFSFKNLKNDNSKSKE